MIDTNKNSVEFDYGLRQYIPFKSKEHVKLAETILYHECEIASVLLISENSSKEFMQPPFNDWSKGNSWQQFYFVQAEGDVTFEIGGSADRFQRETHGRLSHAFAQLARRGIEAPTYCYRYLDNRLQLERTYEKFRCMKDHLTGDYRANWTDTKQLFVQRLLVLNDKKIVELKTA